MVVTVTSLSFPMPISKCTFEGFGQNCFIYLFFLIFEIQLYSDSKRKGMGMTVTNKIPPLNIVM